MDELWNSCSHQGDNRGGEGDMTPFHVFYVVLSHIILFEQSKWWKCPSISCTEAQIQTIQAVLASEGFGLADLAHKHRDRRRASQTERGEEEEERL